MKYKIIAAIMVIIVSAFSFSYGEAQTADHTVGHAVTGQHTLVTNLQTTTVGSTAWAQELTVAPGIATAWLLSYKNEGSTLVPKVVLHAAVPQNHTVVPGSVTWFDPNFPAGHTLTDTGLFNEGVDIGGVAPGGNGFVRFRTILSQTTPCSISSSASAYFEFGASTNKHEAKVSTPACIVATTSAHDSTVPAATPTQPVSTTAESHTSHSSVADTNVPSQPAVPVAPVIQAVQDTLAHSTTHNQPSQTTVAPAPPTPVPAPTPQSTATTHTSHAVAAATTPAATSASTAPTPSPSHSTHTIPETGGNPFWIMLGTVAAGYLVALMRNAIKLSYEAW